MDHSRPKNCDWTKTVSRQKENKIRVIFSERPPKFASPAHGASALEFDFPPPGGEINTSALKPKSPDSRS